MKKISNLTLFFIFTTLLLAVLLLVSRTKGAKNEKTYDSTTVLAKVVPIQELATVKYNYAGVIGFKDNVKILSVSVPLTEKSFLLKYTGYLKAGVDFRRIKATVNNKAVHVSMPQAQIFDVVINENSITVYNESENAFNPIKIADYNAALRKEKDTMRQDAIRQGLLRDAKSQAELAIRSLLQEMGFEQIEITTEVTLPRLQ